MCGQHDFVPSKAFKAIDIYRQNTIKAADLKSFLCRNGYQASLSDGSAIIRRLDMDNDSAINFEEFCAIFPKDLLSSRYQSELSITQSRVNHSLATESSFATRREKARMVYNRYRHEKSSRQASIVEEPAEYGAASDLE